MQNARNFLDLESRNEGINEYEEYENDFEMDSAISNNEEDLNIILEEISVLKLQIFKGGRLHTNALESMKRIFEILSDLSSKANGRTFNPNTCSKTTYSSAYTTIDEAPAYKLILVRTIDNLLFINKKNEFYDILFHCFNCPQLFSLSLRILLMIMENVNFVPEFMRTKKFGFYVSERIFEEITTVLCKKSRDEVWRSMREGTVEELYEKTGDHIFVKESSNIRCLIKLVTAILKEHPEYIFILYFTGFFKLINTLVIKEVAEVYNAVFDKVESSGDYNENINITHVTNGSNLLHNFTEDAIFEIQRKNLTPEVLMRNKELFRFKTHSRKSQGTQLHEIIYNDLLESVLSDLIECFIESVDGVLSYKCINSESNILSTHEIMTFMKEKYAEFNDRRMPRNLRKIRLPALIHTVENLLLCYLKQLSNSSNIIQPGIMKVLLENIKSDYMRYLTVLIYSYHNNNSYTLSFRDVIYVLEYNMPIEHILRVLMVLKSVYVDDSITCYKPTFITVLRYVMEKIEMEIKSRKGEDPTIDNFMAESTLDTQENPMVQQLEEAKSWIIIYFMNFENFLTAASTNVAELLFSKKKMRQTKKKVYKLDGGIGSSFDNSIGIDGLMEITRQNNNPGLDTATDNFNSDDIIPDELPTTENYRDAKFIDDE